MCDGSRWWSRCRIVPSYGSCPEPLRSPRRGHSPSKSPAILSREEYRRWAEAQPRGRYERVSGEVVAMAPERGARLRVKAAVWLALRGTPGRRHRRGRGRHRLRTRRRRDLRRADGGRRHRRAGPRHRGRGALAPDAVPDTGAKLADYFRVPSIQHYLIVRADRRAVIHHRRREGSSIETRLAAEGRIVLDPPGIDILVEDFYAP